MKNLKYYSFIIAAVMVGFGYNSCSDYIDLDPKDKIKGSVLFSDPEGVKQYMANLYYKLPVEDFNYSPMAGKGFNVTAGDPNTGGVILDTYASDGVHSEWVMGVQNDDNQWWEEGYKLNRDVNLLIDEIPNLKVTDSERALLIGESSFIRAYLYFALAKRYGGVCLIKETQEYIPGQIDNLKVPRSTEKETWDFVMEECDKAIANLPEETASWKGSDRRATKWTALALKSRAALHAASVAKYWNQAPLTGTAVDQKLVGLDKADANNFYEQAIKASEEIMNSGRFSLYKATPANPKEAASNYQAIFETPDVAAEEVIFTKGFVRPGKATSHNYDIWYNPSQTANGWVHPGRFNPTLDFVDKYEDYSNPGQTAPIVTTTDGIVGDNNGFNPAKNYIHFDSPAEIFKNKDARFFATVNYPGGVWKNKTLVIQGGIVKPDGSTIIGTSASYEHNGTVYYTFGADNPNNYSGFDSFGAGNMTRSGFLMRKFLSEKVDVVPTWNQSTTDFIDMRYAEVLLNYAEAVLESGYTLNNATDKAAKALNDIRRRAGHTVDIPLNITNVLRERRVELAFENKTYWDLIRRRDLHKEFTSRKLLGLMPLLDLRGSKPQYIMVRVVMKHEYGVTFPAYSYYRYIPGIGTTGVIQNPQY